MRDPDLLLAAEQSAGVLVMEADMGLELDAHKIALRTAAQFGQ